MTAPTTPRFALSAQKRAVWTPSCAGRGRPRLPLPTRSRPSPGARRACLSRSPSPSSGCGSWTSWSRAAAAYNLPAAVRLEGPAGRGGAGSAPWTRWWPATRPCAPPSPPARRARCRWSPPPGGAPARGGPQRPAPGGARGGGRRARAGRGGARPSTSPRARCCGPPCCAWAPAAHVLLLTLHHIVADGWSMGVFIQELGALCDAISRGAEPAAAGAAGAVRGLRGLAARVAAGRGAGGAAGLLAGGAWPALPAPGAPRRPPPPGDPAPPAGPTARAVFPLELTAALKRAGGGRGGDAVHGPAGGLPGPAGALQRAGRPGGGGPGGQPRPRRSWRG